MQTPNIPLDKQLKLLGKQYPKALDHLLIQLTKKYQEEFTSPSSIDEAAIGSIKIHAKLSTLMDLREAFFKN
jgi:hypothetical protein